MTFLILIINLVFLTFLAWKGSRYAEDLKTHYWCGLTMKVGAGLALGLVYKYYYGYGDTFLYFEKAEALANIFYNEPSAYFRFMFSSSSDIFTSGFERQPRALFFTKIVSIFALLTYNNYWVTSLYFSLASFFATFYFIRTSTRHLLEYKLIITVSALYFPSYVFWTSGVVKESFAAVAFFLLLASVFLMSNNEKISFKNILIAVLFGILLWKIKYYYAAITLTMLSSYLITSFLLKKVKLISSGIGSITIVYVVIFISVILLATQLHPNLSLESLPVVIVKNYQAFAAYSDMGSYIRYDELNANWGSILLNTPKALFSLLFRPFIWETNGSLFQLAYSLECLLVLFLFMVAIFHIKLKADDKKYLIVISLLSMVMALSIFLALSAPNYGTLMRYKSLFMPFLMMIILSLNPYLQRIFKTRL